MTLGVVSLNAWTIMILVEAAEELQVFDLGSLMALAPGRLPLGRWGRRLPPLGPLMQGLMNFLVWLTLMGSLISYLIVIHDSASATPLANTFLGKERWPMITAAAVFVLPLCFLDQKALSFTSTLAFVVNVYLIGLLFAEFSSKAGADELPDGACWLGVGRGSVAMLAALAQCIIIQMCVLPMYEQLEDRSPHRFAQALWIAFAILAVVFALFASLGYLSFGPDVQSNVLLNLPKRPATYIAQIATIAVVAAVYPIMVIPMLAPLKKMDLRAVLGARASVAASVRSWRRAIVSGAVFLIVGISYVGALAIDSLGFVNVVDGAVCVGAFTSLVPSFVGLRLMPRSSWSWKPLMFALLAFGLTNAILGICFSDNFQQDVSRHCAWRAEGRTRSWSLRTAARPDVASDVVV